VDGEVDLMVSVRDESISEVEQLYAERALMDTEIQSYLDRIAELEYELAAALAALNRAVATE